MGRIRIGLVGVGKIARDQHLPVLAASPDFQLVGAASRNATVEGLPSYTSLEQMLDARPEIEAVALCTPPGPREADARVALGRGVHVLLEKPPAASLTAMRELIALSGKGILHASWHSRHAPALPQAKGWLAGRRISEVIIEWREDIRVWHPGQNWILEAGGLGVFDPGINALSILTGLIPGPIVLETSRLGVPAQRQAPLTADLVMRSGANAPITASFNFLQTGQQTWTMRISTDDGDLLLSDGGAHLAINGVRQETRAAPHHEYEGVYGKFAECIRSGVSDCDIRPLEIVADAFMLGRLTALPAFDF